MKKIVRVAIGFLLVGAIVRAQNPQTQNAPLIPENAQYVNGVAPGYYPTAGSGLVLNVGPGTANCAGTMITYAGGTLTLAASTTNYIYLNTASSCAPATKTTAFTSSDIPLAVAVAGSSTITSITDDRTMFFPSGADVDGLPIKPLSVISNVNGQINIAAAPYNAKLDERAATCSTTATQKTITCTGANFTAADNSKTITISAGSPGVLAAVITSTTGASIVGTAFPDDNCTVSLAGGTGATAAVQLTSTNTIANGTAVFVTATGSGYSPGLVTGTLSNGSGLYAATCSGPVSLTVTPWYAPITTTLTITGPESATLGTAAISTVTGAQVYIGSDDSAAWSAALTAAKAAGGAIITEPQGTSLVLSCLSVDVSNGPIKLQAMGPGWQGGLHGAPYTPGASAIDLRCSSGPKISTAGQGVFGTELISFVDYGYDSQPFLDFAYTTPDVERTGFFGSGPGYGASLNTGIRAGVSLPFQGYTAHGAIGNLFQNINHALDGEQWFNGFVFADNTIAETCGGADGPIELNGTALESDGNVFAHNLLEVTNYAEAFYLVNSEYNSFIANTVWDVGPLTQATFNLQGASLGNVAICAYTCGGGVVDPNGNGIAVYSAAAQGLAGIGVGPNVIPAGGQIIINSTANKISFVYPTIGETDCSMTSGGIFACTGPSQYNYDATVAAPGFKAGNSGPAAVAQGQILLDSTANKISFVYPTIGETDCSMTSGGIFACTGPSQYNYDATVAAPGFKAGNSGPATVAQGQILLDSTANKFSMVYPAVGEMDCDVNASNVYACAGAANYSFDTDILIGSAKVPVASSTQTAGQLACIKSAGPPPVIGTCTAVSGASCTTCN